MINVSAGRSIVFDDSAARNPIANGLGLGGSCKAKANRFVVEESKTVVVKHAIKIHGSETTGFLIPETVSAVVTNFGRVLTKIGGIECISAASDAPLRMLNDVLFKFGEAQ